MIKAMDAYSKVIANINLQTPALTGTFTAPLSNESLGKVATASSHVEAVSEFAEDNTELWTAFKLDKAEVQAQVVRVQDWGTAVFNASYQA